MLVAGAGVLGLLAVSFVLYRSDHVQALVTTLVSSSDGGGLAREVNRLREANAALSFELTRLERAAEIDAEVRRDNHRQLVEMERQLATLERESEFFREVMGETKVAARTQIRGMQVTALAEERRYGYRLVLAHVDDNDKVAEGSLRVGLKGTQEGRAKAYRLAEMVEQDAAPMNFKFKHFRLFEGTLRLPPGFEPETVQVEVLNTAPVRGAVSATYDWAAVLN